jgi:hypothetical protein
LQNSQTSRADNIHRYDRVKAVQKTGETTRDMWHKADWDKVKKNPESVQFPREDWIHTFDAEKHTEEVFEENFAAIKAGEKSVQEKNVPATSKVGAVATVKEVSIAGEVEVNGTH